METRQPEELPRIDLELTLPVDRIKVGTSVGSYKILEILGEGGFGVVYLAEQTEPVRRRVALKVIKPGMDTAAVIARFEAERQALAMMDHPNVAKVFDAGTTEKGRPYFVMEHVAGVPITEHCDRHQLGIDERLDLFIRVCEAVQHAHQKGIIHRDIKPSNILVAYRDGESVPKVIDFGVAKAIEQRLTEHTIFTQQGQLIGTPAYMSPEQAEMTAQDVDTRTDIYSLGVLLYELLTGTLPFDPTSLRQAAFDEIRRIIREVEPPKPSTKLSSAITEGGDGPATMAQRRRMDPRTLTRRLRGDLDWITMKALEKDRARRYASATDFASDIRRHMTDEPVLASPPSAGYRVKKFVRRNRGVVVAVSVVLVVLIAGISGTTLALLDANEARALAEDRRKEAEAGREEASRQANISRGINDFLNDDLLGAVAPEEQGREVLMREVLDAASKAIEGKFPDGPLIEASIRLTLGNTYRSLAEYKVAEPHLERAVALRRSTLGEEHPETLSAVNALAVLYSYQGRHDEAEPLLLEMLERRRRVLGDEHPNTLKSMNNMAIVLLDHGKYGEAETLFRQILEIQRRVLGDEHPDTLGSMNNLSMLLLTADPADLRDPEAALRLAQQAVDKSRSRIPYYLDTLALAYQMTRDVDSAVEAQRKALSSLPPGESPVRNEFEGRFIQYLRERGDFAEMEQLHRDILARRRKELPGDAPATTEALCNLGTVLIERHNYTAAEPMLLECHERLKKNPDTPPARLTEALTALAQLYDSMSDPTKAAAWRAKLEGEGTEALRH
ncbi:MAG: serine/threonine-protein kinase [Phycisphaerae bacterium]